MDVKFDPIIEAALIQAAASLAVGASELQERNLRAASNLSSPHGLPIIEDKLFRSDSTGTLAAYFRDMLVEVRDAYAGHLKVPRVSARPK